MRALLLAVLLCASVSAQAPDERNYGHPHQDPRTLTALQVDPQMWPIVRLINQSGWVWTTESCQGHEGQPVVLGLVTDDPGRLFGLLSQVHAEMYPDRSEELQDPEGFSVRLDYFVVPQVKLGRTQIRLTVGDPEQRAQALRVFAVLSRAVTRTVVSSH